MLPLPDAATPFVYIAFAAALAAACHFWVRPLSRGAAAVLVLLPLAFTGPALLTGRIYSPFDLAYLSEPLAGWQADFGIRAPHNPETGDIAFMLLPQQKAVRHALKHGVWPLWNPFLLGGQVLAAEQQPAAYHPIRLASYFLPLGPSLSFCAAALLFVAGLTAFLYARDLGCRESAALIGAAAWAFSSFIVAWLPWAMGLAAAGLPLLFLGARRVARAPGWRATLVLTAGFVVLLLGGHPETTLHGVTAAALYGLAELAVQPRRQWLRGTVSGVGAGVLALALCAFDVLPFVEALPQTREYVIRHQHFVDQDRSVEPAEALSRLRTAVLPFAYGLPWEERAPSPPFFVPRSSAYVGSVLLAPVLFGLWRSRRRIRWVWLGFVLFGALAGASAPGVSDLLARLPLFDLAINERLVMLAGLGFAVLAALGSEAWAAAGDRARGLARFALAIALGLALLVTWEWMGLRASGLSAAFLQRHSLVLVVPLFVLAALVAAFRRRPSRVLVGLLLLLMGQRTLEAARTYPALPAAAFYPEVDVLTALPRGGPPYRVVGLGVHLHPNTATLYELEDVRGYTAMTHRLYAQTYALWSDSGFAHLFNQVHDLERPFLSFLNVHYGFLRKQAPIPAGWSSLAEGRALRLVENTRALARAFVPRVVHVGVPGWKQWQEMEAETDFGHRAWIADPQAKIGRRGANGQGRVTAIDAPTPGRYRLKVEMDETGWVVVSETAWKGWRATSGGEDLPLRLANNAFLAFQLPPGRHEVALDYRPASFVAGLRTSAATALLLLAGLAFGLRRRQRSRAVDGDGPPCAGQPRDRA